LVNVHLRDGLTIFGAIIDLSWSTTSSSVIKRNYNASTCQLLHQFYTLRVILFLDLFFIGKRSAFGRPIVVPKTRAVEAYSLLSPPNVLDLDIVMIANLTELVLRSPVVGSALSGMCVRD